MKIIFLMDPLETVNPYKDTTLMLMRGAYRRGFETIYVAKNGISLNNGKVFFKGLSVIPQENNETPFVIGKPVHLSSDDIKAVFIRPDPPFNEQYLMNTWMLDHLPENVVVINSPRGIRTVNEKVWVTQFTSLVPPTLISCDKNEIKHFVDQHQRIIAKPTNAYGGQSVFLIERQDKNANTIIETLSERYLKPIILQRYIPEAVNGDKRILLLNGEFLGILLRIHGEDDHRNNFFAGGKPSPAVLTTRDEEIITTLKPHLQQLGLCFVGIDILGDYLIEVNVTSPTCLQEINYISQTKLEEKVIDFLAKLIK